MTTPSWKIGHTCITWKEANLDLAVKDIAAAGYQGFETFAWLINPREAAGGTMRQLIDETGIPLVSCFLMQSMLDPEKQKADFETLDTTIRNLKNLGCDCVVLSAKCDRQASYTADEFKRIVGYGDEIGKRLNDEGIRCAFHPHTGTHIETRDEIYRFMESVNPDWVQFGPDVGQIAKGGADAVAVVRDFASRIAALHLKDYVGGAMRITSDGKLEDRTGYEDYLPLGDGVVDFPGIVETLRESGYRGWLMAELDNMHETGPIAPGECIRRSKTYIETTLGIPVGPARA